MKFGVYDDEDNYPMNDSWEERKDYRRSQIREGFLDDLGFLRESKCRECRWMQDGVISRFMDGAERMPGEAYDLAQRMCRVCRTTPEEKRTAALEDFFRKEGE